MNTVISLDLSIKNAEQKNTSDGYILGDRLYSNYMDNESWSLFVEKMKNKYPTAYTAYGSGAGDELALKKIGRFPPKMASFGSSSRMIYLLSRDIDGFCFEEKLSTTLGGIAHMDGYLHKDKTQIYVEAKCREPYSSKSYVIDRKYQGLYEYIDASSDVNVNCHITVLDEDKMKVKFVSDGVEITRFDLKQMICHLLGIATRQLGNPMDEKIRFLYLLYNPKLIGIENEKDKNKIYSIYETEVRECESIPFASLFGVILEYLKANNIQSDLNVVDCVKRFEFALCDQNSYNSKLVAIQ